jgi:hypothetical protein
MSMTTTPTSTSAGRPEAPLSTTTPSSAATSRSPPIAGVVLLGRLHVVGHDAEPSGGPDFTEGDVVGVTGVLCGVDVGANPFYITLHGNDADVVTACWERLADHATVLIPLVPAAFAPLYGMVTDRFGITWIVGAGQPPSS